jgi:hypothetical protein
MGDTEENNNILQKTFNILKGDGGKKNRISQLTYTNENEDENIDIYMSESSDNMIESSNR